MARGKRDETKTADKAKADKAKGAKAAPAEKSAANPGGDASQKDRVQSKDVRRVISERVLKQLMKDVRAGDKDARGISGQIREKIGYAVREQHLNPEVFSLIRRLDRKEPEKLADFISCFEHMWDISGLADRAASATKNMQFGSGAGAEEDDPPETQTADEPTAQTSTAPNQDNVKPFPAQKAVAAE